MVRRSRRLLVAVAAVVVTAAAVVVGVLLSRSPSPPAPPAAPLATPLSAVDTTTLVVRRQPFCGNVSDADVAAALGGPAHAATAYDPGQRTQLGGTHDVADEHGCRWTGPHGAQAAAWVFSPPVTPQWARQLAADRPAGCHPIQAPAYGRPTTAYTCAGTITLSGLFGDAWLSCQLHTDQRDLAGRWCLAVARAAG